VSGGGLSVEAQSSVDQFRALYVRHPRAEAVEEHVLRSVRRAARDRHLTMLIGPAGVGKTRVMRRILERFDKEADEDRSPDRIGAVHILLEPHGGAYHAARIDRLILAAVAEPLVDRKLILPGEGAAHLSYRGTNEARRRSVLNVLQIRRPVVLALDEAQHLSYLSGRGIQQALDDLKTIVDISAVPLLFCGSYELARFGGLSAQLARRTEEIHFSRYTGRRSDWRDFLATLKDLAEKASFAFDPLEEDVARRLYAGCIGCIGLLVSWIAKALERALSNGRSAVMLDDLEATAMGDGKLGQMLDDALSGEGAMQLIAGDRRGLYEKLGLTPKRKRQRAANQGRPGQRKPVRDAVGAAPEATDAESA